MICGRELYYYLLQPRGMLLSRLPATDGTHKDDASGGDGAAVDTSAGLFNNPLSESSSGKLFKMQRIYDFKGNRMFTDNQILDRRKAARLSPHRMPKNSRTCEKWAVITTISFALITIKLFIILYSSFEIEVVTTIFSPTTTVKQLLEFKEWCVVVAGDKKSPPESKEEYERVSKDKPGHLVYLSPHDQSSLGYGTTPLLNWNHFGRKNVAFIYAIQHGAKVIYDVDDDNVLSEPKEPPLDALFELPSSQQPSSSSRHHQHSVIKDMLHGVKQEVIWAPTTHHLFNPYPYFDPQKPKKQPEFIWDLGHVMGFSSSFATQYRNPHSYLADFESEVFLPFIVAKRRLNPMAFALLLQLRTESQLYLRAGALTSFLCQWKSSEVLSIRGSLEGRIEDLFITMYEHGILHIKDVQLAQSFILDLLKAGYIFPPIKKSWGKYRIGEML
eukprot:jgi/Bigna1/145881/aug1.105_g20589